MLGPRQRRPRLPLADALLLIAHDKYTGKPKVRELAIGYGLGAALLCELIVKHERVVITHTHEIKIVDFTPPSDPLAYTLLDQIRNERTITRVRTWLSYLALNAYGWVGDRMSRCVPPVAAPVEVRQGLLRKKVTMYVPLDSTMADWPIVHIQTLVARGDMLQMPDVLLAALLVAVGLDGELQEDWTDEHKRYLNNCIARLPSSLGFLLAETTAAIGAAVLTQRG